MVAGASTDILQAFSALVRAEIEDERVDLLRSALTFARIEDPHLDIEHYVQRMDELATRVAEKIDDPDDPVPYWLVSTRRPQQLAEALREAASSTLTG